MQIELPISKSIANRLLILQSIHGDELMPVSATLPEDVQILHRALTTLHHSTQRYTTLNLSNCGTAMRFLTAYAAQLENKVTVLDGVERMRHRPIGQLVDALREIGADIEYLGEEGFPPLRIKGCILDKDRIITLDNPQSTQFVSALLLIGANVQTNSTSPYITLTREIIDQYPIAHRASNSPHCGCPITAQAASSLEKDWSSAAFWYEYVALYGGEITLPGLSRDSLQGDKVVADIFAHLGVHTEYTPEGIILSPIAYSEASHSLNEASYPWVEICGIMGMATNTDDEAEWRRCFRAITSLASHLSPLASSPIAYSLSPIAHSEASHSSPSERPQISMGMSDDYLVAIEEGSTMVRIGSTIFGTRTSKL